MAGRLLPTRDTLVRSAHFSFENTEFISLSHHSGASPSIRDSESEEEENVLIMIGAVACQGVE
jgi:hypothetical protein